MLLALSLARYGVKSLLVERNETTTKHPKMDLTNGRSMELLRPLNLTEQMRDAGVPRENPFDIVWLTSPFLGREIRRFPYPSANEARAIAARENDGASTREPALRISQIVVESVFKRALDASPLVDVRFGTAFERIVSHYDNGVVCEVSDCKTQKTEQIRAQYLAGCDGAGSRVRRELGIQLDGQMSIITAYMIHFRTDERELMRRYGIAWHLENNRGTIICQNDDDIYTLHTWIPEGVKPEDVRPGDLLEAWIGTPFRYEILQANPWSANLVVAQRFCEGRVSLAGDSAHQFFPAGGYGMNSGVGDAAGLSWTLAALVQGWGGAGLLAAYECERKSVAWWHMDAVRRHIEVRQQIAQAYEAGGDLNEPGSEGDSRRRRLANELGALGMAEYESLAVQCGYRYDNSAIILHESGAPAMDPLHYRPSTWPGSRLPHVFLEADVSVFDKLGLWFTLIVLDDIDCGAISRAAEQLHVPLTIVKLGRPALRSVYGRNLLLVRPDQYVAWRGDSLPDDCSGLLKTATGH